MPDKKIVLKLAIDGHMLSHGGNPGSSYYCDQIMPLHIPWEKYDKVIFTFPDLWTSVIDYYFLTGFIGILNQRISPKAMSEKIEFGLYPDISNGFRQPDKDYMARQAQELNDRFHDCLAAVVRQLK